MADFTSATTKIQLAWQAGQALDAIREVYNASKKAQAMLDLYSTDANFKAAADFVYGAAQIAELAAMRSDINTLVTAWEAQHKTALQIP